MTMMEAVLKECDHVLQVLVDNSELMLPGYGEAEQMDWVDVILANTMRQDAILALPNPTAASSASSDMVKGQGAEKMTGYKTLTNAYEPEIATYIINHQMGHRDLN